MGQTAPASPPRDAAAGLKVNYLRSWLSLTMTLLVICYLLNMVMGLPRAGLPRVLTYYVGASAALMSRGFLRLTTILVRPILPFLAPLDGAVWRVMNYDVEREEQPIVKIPALLPWAAPLPSKTGPGSLLIAL